MEWLALFTSTEGRLARGPFAWGVVAVYVAGFASQALLAPAVFARSGMWPFVFVQGVLIWAWLCLHIKRARDAGHGKSGAVSVAVIYTLALGLLLLVISLFAGAGTPPAERAPGEAQPTGQALMAMFLVILIFGMLFTPDFGLFATMLKVLLLVACLPGLISFAFSLVTGMRASAAPSASAPPAPQ